MRPLRAKHVSVKDLIADAVIIGMSAALVRHLSNIWRYGQHLIQEPNTVIKSVERGLLVILAFGIGKFISDLKRTGR